jgi:hypothetical protein
VRITSVAFVICFDGAEGSSDKRCVVFIIIPQIEEAYHVIIYVASRSLRLGKLDLIDEDR